MWSSSLRAKNSGSVPYVEKELDTSCILFLAVIFHCVLLDICYGCLLSLSTWALLVSLDMCSVCLIHLWLPTGKFFSWRVLTAQNYRCFAETWYGCDALQASCWLAVCQLPFQVLISCCIKALCSVRPAWVWLSLSLLSVPPAGVVGGGCRDGSASGWMLCPREICFPVASQCSAVTSLSAWHYKAYTLSLVTQFALLLLWIREEKLRELMIQLLSDCLWATSCVAHGQAFVVDVI